MWIHKIYQVRTKFIVLLVLECGVLNNVVPGIYAPTAFDRMEGNWASSGSFLPSKNSPL